MKFIIWFFSGIALVAKGICALFELAGSDNKGKHAAKKVGGKAAMKRVGRKFKGLRI